MNKKIICTLFIMFIIKSAQCQIYFNNNYEYNSSVSNASSVLTCDTNYIFPASIYASSYGSLLVNVINIYGDTLFTKEYKKNGYVYSTGTSNSIIHTFDDNVVFSGASVDTANNVNALLVKINKLGDTLWTKTYGGANFDNANIVHQTADSGFVLMGVTQSFSVGPASDFYMIKTDKDGNFEWQKTYGTSATEDCVSGQITLDGGFILSGHRNNQLHIVKTDSAGNFQWEKVYAGTAGQGFIKQLQDSTYILVGAKYISASVYKAYMAKLSKTGNIIWQNTYGGAGNQQFYAIPIVLSDGSIVCSGVSINSIEHGLLVKTDSSGNQIWLRTYYKNMSAPNYIYDSKLTIDNGFILSGTTFVLTSDPWLMKVDEFGCEVSNCNVGVEEYENEDLGFLIYPNPAISSINVISKKYQVQSIKIIDLLGRELYFVQNNTTEIDISQLPKGMHILQVQTEKGVVSKKWVKE